MSKKPVRVIAIGAALVLLVVCSRTLSASEEKTRIAEPAMTDAPVCVTDFFQTQEPEPEQNPWTEAELDAMVRTLAGECYDQMVEDKRRVCEVILNRVSDGRFGDSVIEVLSAENQFSGYWTQSRPVSENDYEVAEQALRDWYDNGCKALSEYLFFSAGDGLENVFRSEY